jgi:hypothetical protein
MLDGFPSADWLRSFPVIGQLAQKSVEAERAVTLNRSNQRRRIQAFGCDRHRKVNEIVPVALRVDPVPDNDRRPRRPRQTNRIPGATMFDHIVRMAAANQLRNRSVQAATLFDAVIATQGRAARNPKDRFAIVQQLLQF